MTQAQDFTTLQNIADKLKISPEKQVVLDYVNNATTEQLDELIAGIRNRRVRIGTTRVFAVADNSLEVAWFQLDEIEAVQAFMVAYLAKEKPMKIAYDYETYPTPDALANLAETRTLLKAEYPEVFALLMPNSP